MHARVARAAGAGCRRCDRARGHALRGLLHLARADRDRSSAAAAAVALASDQPASGCRLAVGRGAWRRSRSRRRPGRSTRSVTRPAAPSRPVARRVPAGGFGAAAGRRRCRLVGGPRRAASAVARRGRLERRRLGGDARPGRGVPGGTTASAWHASLSAAREPTRRRAVPQCGSASGRWLRRVRIRLRRGGFGGGAVADCDAQIHQGPRRRHARGLEPDRAPRRRSSTAARTSPASAASAATSPRSAPPGWPRRSRSGKIRWVLDDSSGGSAASAASAVVSPAAASAAATRCSGSARPAAGRRRATARCSTTAPVSRQDPGGGREGQR